jgi:hypothetical protein
MTRATIELYETLITNERSGMGRQFAIDNLQGFRDALLPFVGKQLCVQECRIRVAFTSFTLIPPLKRWYTCHRYHRLIPLTLVLTEGEKNNHGRTQSWRPGAGFFSDDIRR